MPEAEAKSRLDEFGQSVFASLDIDEPSDKLVDLYLKVKRVKDRIHPGRFTPEAFALIIVMSGYEPDSKALEKPTPDRSVIQVGDEARVRINKDDRHCTVIEIVNGNKAVVKVDGMDEPKTVRIQDLK